MTELKKRKPKGGVERVVLYPAGGISVIEDVAAVQGVEVELVDDRSSYEELFLSNDGLVGVEHTLTLCSQQRDASPWLDKEFLRRVAVEGVVALITLASGYEILVGWSERFAVEQALRLKSLNVISGKRPTDLPRVELTLWSHDTESAFV